MTDPSRAWDDVKNGVEWLWLSYPRLRMVFSDLAGRLQRGSSRETTDEESLVPGILILGPGGVGKSTFAKLITDAVHPLADAPVKYQESIGVESYTLQQSGDGGDVELVVPPGQEHRRSDSWPDLLRDLQNGRFRGVIFFSAFGHHALGETSYKSHVLYAQHGKKKPAFVRAFLEKCRADELRVLEDVAAHLKLCSERIWMLSIVTKQDLWWKDRSAVENHYQSGSYSAIMHEVASHRGADSFRHEIAFVSLVIRRLMTGQGEVLKDNVAGYDQEFQLRSLRHLAMTIDALRQWEEGT